MSGSSGSGTVAHLGLWGATGVGVGAIVGGGILALSGVAFAATGPSAILAFALNGALAAVTARSFAALSTAFPESGGTYTFAKKVLSVETAFLVGWVVWFASIVAAVLYALGFAYFVVEVLARVWVGGPPAWLRHRGALLALAVAATLFYAQSLARRSHGGGQWATLGKLGVFAIIIGAGLWAFVRAPSGSALPRLEPFFARGGVGFFEAMGYTFIALQGFDLIAAVGGEVREPGRNLPRSMYLSLAIALAVYLPLLFFVATVGVRGEETIAELSRADPDAVIAVAAQRFVGPVGWWLVVVAALLAMLSALQANLYGASRVAYAMGRDRTLPTGIVGRRAGSDVPRNAVLVTAAVVVATLLAISNLAAAGAAASLVFLVSFAMVHWAQVLLLLRTRTPGLDDERGRLRGDAALPIAGAIACLGLAVFQGLAVASAGAVVALWLLAGLALYLVKLAPRARVADASAQASDPQLLRMRGLSPLVLVPIANPAGAESLVSTASCLAAPGVGRVLLLSVVKPPNGSDDAERARQLADVQAVLGKSLHASFEGHLAPETLITVASEPWREIARAARVHRCESVLLRVGSLEDPEAEQRVEWLMSRVDADVVVQRAPPDFRLSQVQRVLVPVGGRRDQSHLRARLLTSLWRTGAPEMTYLRVLPPDASSGLQRLAERDLGEMARDEVPGRAEVRVACAHDPLEEVCRAAEGSDLVVLGIQRRGRWRKVFGSLPVALARRTGLPTLLVSRRG